MRDSSDSRTQPIANRSVLGTQICFQAFLHVEPFDDCRYSSHVLRKSSKLFQKVSHAEAVTPIQILVMHRILPVSMACTYLLYGNDKGVSVPSWNVTVHAYYARSKNKVDKDGRRPLEVEARQPSQPRATNLTWPPELSLDELVQPYLLLCSQQNRGRREPLPTSTRIEQPRTLNHIMFVRDKTHSSFASSSTISPLGTATT